MSFPVSESFAGAATGDINGRTLDGQAGITWFGAGSASTSAISLDGAGKAFAQILGGVGIYWTTDTASQTDYKASVVGGVVTAAGAIGTIVGLTSTTGAAADTRFYLGRFNKATDKYEIVKYTLGSYVVLADAPGTFSATDSVETERTVSGGNAILRVLKNGTAVVGPFTDTAPDSHFLQAGQYGIWQSGSDASTGYRFDSFTVSAVGAAGATAYTLAAPSPASGVVNVASGNFTVTPNGTYTGTITITPSGGGLSTPIVKTFSASSAPQTFTITPTAVGTVTLTPTNSGGLTNPSAVTYTVTATPSAAPNADFYELGAGLAGLVGTVGVTLYSINSDATRTLARARTTAGIAEDPDVPGTYHVAFPDGFAGVALLDTGGSPPALVVPLKVGGEAGTGAALDAYERARLIGNVEELADSSLVYRDADDPSVKRLKFAPVAAPGGRTVTKDPA